MKLINLIPYLTIIYIILICFRLGAVSGSRLLHTQNIWYQDFFTSSQISRARSATTFTEFDYPYYNHKNTLAYITAAGTISHFIRGDHKLIFSPSKKAYLSYNAIGSNITFYDYTGRKKWSLLTPGYAHLSPQGSIVLVVSTDNSSITLYNQARERLLPKTYLGAYITDFQFAPYNDSLVLGTIEGTAYHYKYLSAELETWEVPSSLYTYIKSIEISQNAQYIAILSGLQPERLTLYQTQEQTIPLQTSTPTPLNTQLTLLWSIETQQALRKKNSMFIDEANHQLLELRGQTLYILNLKTGAVMHTEQLSAAAQTPIVYTRFASLPGFYTVVSYQNNMTVLKLFNANSHILHWEQIFPDSIPLSVELKAHNQALDLRLTTHTVVYYYRLYPSL